MVRLRTEDAMLERSRHRFLSLTRKRSGIVALIALVGLCASVVMYQITAQGPGVDPDSIIYIRTAEALLARDGFFVSGQPMAHYPPVFPLLLAFVGWFTGGDILLAARLLAALLFGVNVVLLALAVCACTRYSLVAAGCAILLFLVSKPILSIHSMAWSEAPFITFSMAGLILLSEYVAYPRLRLLVLASLMVGVAAATRYIGGTLLPTAVLALFFLSNQSFRNKMRDIVLLLGIACLPLGFWVVRNLFIARTATNRELVFHPCTLYDVKRLIGQIYDFVLPISIPPWTKILHVATAAILFVFAARLLLRRTSTRQRSWSIGVVLSFVLATYSVVYATSLFLSISFFDAATPVNKRLLLPVFLALIVVATSFVKAFSEICRLKRAWYGYVALVCFSVSCNAGPAISAAVDLHHNGKGYTARHWRNSETLNYLPGVPETMAVYSNGPDVIGFLTEREANMIPRKEFPCTRRKNPNYQRQMRHMMEECKKGNALIVYLNRITWRWYLPSQEEIEDILTIPVATVMEDGVVYRISVERDNAEQNAGPNGDTPRAPEAKSFEAGDLR